MERWKSQEHVRIALGVADVSDCFHRLRLKGGIRNYLCWPPLRAGLLGITQVEGLSVGPNDLVWPANGSLPMGFVRSLFFAQHVNFRKLSHLPSLSGAHAISDRGPPWVFSSVAAQAAFYVYVDNLGVFDQSGKFVEKVMDEANCEFVKNGLHLHENEI